MVHELEELKRRKVPDLGVKISDKRGRAVFEKIKNRYENSKYGCPKWVLLIERLIQHNKVRKWKFRIYIYDAKSTNSKYITVVRGEDTFTIRISNHSASSFNFRNRPCDFYVGKHDFSDKWYTYKDAYNATLSHFKRKSEVS